MTDLHDKEKGEKIELKQVKFWDTEDKTKDQMLTCYRDGRTCCVIEFTKTE